MKTQHALRENAVLKKHFIGAHPIIQWFIDKLWLREIVGQYIAQDGRAALTLEKTLDVLIHNIRKSSTCPAFSKILDLVKEVLFGGDTWRQRLLRSG